MTNIATSSRYIQLWVKSASKCQEVCNMANYCYNYSYCDGVCYLKKEGGWQSSGKSGCTSGNHDGSLIHYNTDYYGGDLTYENGGSKGLSVVNSFNSLSHGSELCRYTCANLTYCWYYSFCQGECFFKSKRGWIRKDDSDCTSGDYKGTYKSSGVNYMNGDTY